MWREILALLASLSADPVQIETETPRAAAAVSVARASMARPRPTPPPQPDDGKCCTDCGGTGRIVHADGHSTECPCPASCDCKRGQDPQLVPIGKSSASPARAARSH